MGQKYVDSEGIVRIWSRYLSYIKAITDVTDNAALKTDLAYLTKIITLPTQSSQYTEVSSIPNSTTINAASLGTYYKITAAYTTTSDFIEGAGISCPANSYVIVVKNPTNANSKKLACVVDMDKYAAKGVYDVLYAMVNVPSSNYTTVDSIPNFSSAAVGTYYKITTAYTTTSDFVEGAGVKQDANTFVVVTGTFSDVKSTSVSTKKLACVVDLGKYFSTSNIVDDAAVISGLSALTGETSKIPTVRTVASLINSFISSLDDKLNKASIIHTYGQSSSDTAVYDSNVIKSKTDSLSASIDACADTTWMTNNNIATKSDITTVYRHQGDIGVTNDSTPLVASLTTAQNKVGYVYNVTGAFTTDSRFNEYASVGAKRYPAGTSIVVAPPVTQNGNNTLDIFIGYAAFETLDETDINAAISTATAQGPLFVRNVASPQYIIELTFKAADSSPLTGYTRSSLYGGVGVITSGTNNVIYETPEHMACKFKIQVASGEKVVIYMNDAGDTSGKDSIKNTFSASEASLVTSGATASEVANDVAALYGVLVFTVNSSFSKVMETYTKS